MKSNIIIGKQISIENPRINELTIFFGLSKTKASIICSNLHISKNTTLQNLSPIKIVKLTIILQKILLEASLRKNIIEDFQHLKNVKNYRSYRHIIGIPVRGQNTKNNSKTQKKRAIKRIKLNK
jgi:small subunit ribosomal protein S13